MDSPPRALISVNDKTGVVGLAAGLVELGWELLASAGTAQQVLQGRSFAGGRPDPVLVSGKGARGRRAVPPAARGLRRRRDRGADGGRCGCRRGETVGLGGPEAGWRNL